MFLYVTKFENQICELKCTKATYLVATYWKIGFSYYGHTICILRYKLLAMLFGYQNGYRSLFSGRYSNNPVSNNPVSKTPVCDMLKQCCNSLFVTGLLLWPCH